MRLNLAGGVYLAQLMLVALLIGGRFLAGGLFLRFWKRKAPHTEWQG
jgi:hypothetical protein